MKILIVGGGTAGYVTALILKQALDAQVDMIHSSKIGIIGVGEGSTEHFYHFMKYIGLDHGSLIKETDATLKAGVMFRGWTDKDYLHSVGGVYPNKHKGYPAVYSHLVANDDPWMSGPFVWKNVLPGWSVHPHGDPPFNQFHFNTFKLNSALDSLARERGISVTDTEVVAVEVAAGSLIRKIHTTAGVYQDYDLYVDATGSTRRIVSPLGARWRSYSRYLRMNSAIVFPTEDTDNYNLWTLARAMDSGWMFTIPVWGRHGNGYIYNSDYSTSSSAQREVEELLGHPIEVARYFQFDPGRLEEAWIGNAVAVGMAGSFVEPMEASSIGTTIQQAFLLASVLPDQSPATRDAYNRSFVSIMDNIRDFVALHYVVERDDTPWWKDLRYGGILPDSLQERLKVWKHRLPIPEDFSGESRHILFSEDNFTVVLNGLGLLDKDEIRTNHRARSLATQQYAQDVVDRQRSFETTDSTITHKQYLAKIRANQTVTS